MYRVWVSYKKDREIRGLHSIGCNPIEKVDGKTVEFNRYGIVLVDGKRARLGIKSYARKVILERVF